MENRILADVEMKEGTGYKEALQNSLIVKETTTHSVASDSSNPKAKLVDKKLHESSGKLKEKNSLTEDSPQDSYFEIKPKFTKAEINKNLAKPLLTDNK
ncbi:14622_t:CDS:1, partial [Dentiscutata heterogama]